MSPKKLDLSAFRIHDLAEALDQNSCVIKLCLWGPYPNVETGSIDDIKTIDEARKMMRKAQSRERRRLIAKKWFGLCTCMSELQGPFSDFGSPDLYHDDDLRHFRDTRANEMADSAINSDDFGLIYECWRASPHGFIQDKLTLALLEKSRIVCWGMLVIDNLEKTGRIHSESTQWIYWAFMQKMAELADRKQAKELLDVIQRHRRFDHENPTVSFLVQKVATAYRHKFFGPILREGGVEV
ncbi:MAG: hypothetical protein WCV82_00575 [Candidatus Paceibacterota bacterium]